MSSIELLLVTGVLIPLASFVLLALFGAKLGKPLAGWVAVAAIATSCVLGTIALVQWHGMEDAARAAAHSAPVVWATLGDIPLKFGVNLDSLTLIMFFMVSFVSACIFVFSVGYMAGHSDEIDGVSKFHRFFTYLSLFCFSMLLLVIADSLLLLFIAWELVGLCSYLLIGFYFHKQSASNAGIKAFVTNRVGDFGFIIGLGMVFFFLGDLSLSGAADRFREQYHAGGALFSRTFLGLSLATWMGMLLFCGAIGKSAQFPLHVWLPDAMEGPTPVSALIHAATMVAAGVYLTARIFVLLTPEAQLFVAVIGCITLTLAALVAIVQTDIKKVLAYSTISQLGYMMLGLGVGAWIAALFHLLTHAYFKALMFLGSGQVIEGCHHEQDIRKMGGLWRKMPVTAFTFLVGVLAIAGAGIPLMKIGLGGYFSKDEILAVAWHRAYGHAGGGHAEQIEHTGAPTPGHTGAPTPGHAGAPTSGHTGAPTSGHTGAPTSGRPSGEFTAAPAARNELRIQPASFYPEQDGRLAASTDQKSALEKTDHRSALQKTDQRSTLQRSSDAPHGTPTLPGWLFWVPVIIAYVTSFYMMRCWWLTFMGQPRDHQVYEHAHESKLMYLPLVVLAIGTFFASYFLFRPMVAAAAPKSDQPSAVSQQPAEHAAALAGLGVTYDGAAAQAEEAHATMIDHAAHQQLAVYVGFAFVVGFVLAWLIYRKGLAAGEAIAKALRPLHTLLIKKFYFDEAYGLVLVGGTMVLKEICYLFDKYVVDFLVNLSAWITERLSAFSGSVLDQGVVDGAVNGVGRGTWELGGLVRQPQVGRIRNYILFAATGVAVVVLWMAFR